LLPGILHHFVVAFSRANMSLEVATPGEVWRRFVDERYDMAIAPRTHDTPAYADWLFDDQDALYVHPSDALARAAPTRPLYVPTLLAPLAREPERHVDDHLRRRHVTFGRRLDIRNLESAKQLVEAGVGAGLFSRSTVTRELADNRMAELTWLDLDIQTSWYLGVAPGSRRAPLVDHLAALVEAEAASWRNGDLYAGRTG
jgi:DNA-binding transcriptional LysR family regulator